MRTSSPWVNVQSAVGAALFATLSVVASGCGSATTETKADSADRVELASNEAVVATAIDDFPKRYGRDATIVVVPSGLEATLIAELLTQPRYVGTVVPTQGRYVRVEGVKRVREHWEVTIWDLEDSNAFGATIVITQQDDTLKSVNPEEVGITVTTSVS